MLQNPDFEQDYWSRTATGLYRIGHSSIRLVKWLAYYDRSFYENINYFNLISSVLTCLNEISQRWIWRRGKRSPVQNSSNWK